MQPLFDIVTDVRPRPAGDRFGFVGFEAFLNDAPVPLWDWKTLRVRDNPVLQRLDIVDLFIDRKALEGRRWY